VVVLHDMLGYGAGHPPRSVKQYAHLFQQLREAFEAYTQDVHNGQFPTVQGSISMNPEELQQLHRTLGRSD